MPNPPAGLTPKQERFCKEYLVDLNATQAAIRAGYSTHTASEQGYQLLQHPSLSARVIALQAERATKVDIKAEDVLRGLIREATDRDPGSSHSARVRALELLGKHLGLFTERLALEEVGPLILGNPWRERADGDQKAEN